MDINLNVHPSSLEMIEETLTSVEEILNTQPVTEEIRDELMDQLDQASKTLSLLEQGAAKVNQFALSYFQQLRDKAISLYGDVDDSYLHHEVVVLQDKTRLLQETLLQQQTDLVRTTLEGVHKQMSKILTHFLPALAERRVLVNAKLVLERAQAYLEGRKLPNLTLEEWEVLETEAVLEEIADYLAEGNRAALRRIMKSLSPTQKKLILAYLEPQDLLTSTLHDIEGSTDQNILFAG